MVAVVGAIAGPDDEEVGMDALILITIVAGAFWIVGAALTWLVEDVVPAPLRPLSRGVAGRYRRRRGEEPLPDVLLELELRRLAAGVQREHSARAPGQAERIRSWMLAYDWVLIELGERCAVEPPRRSPPLSRAERGHLEHALVGQGRSW